MKLAKFAFPLAVPWMLLDAHAGAAPTVTGPIPGAPYLSPQQFRVSFSERGYTEEEYFITGTATAFTAEGPMPADGRITVRPGDTAPYTTRIVVRRPSDPKKFNGTAIVEWLNVSGGTDAAPDFAFLHRDIVREGYAWVGVSAQQAGLQSIPGMPPGMAKPVKTADPDRYQRLAHPGDAYSFDIFSQAGAVIRGGSNTPAQLQTLHPQCVLAIGESQSAFFLTTYVNAVDPRAKVYDGYLIHARGGFAASLTGIRLDRANAKPLADPVLIRSDVRVPVLMVQSETDLMILGSVAARQPDTERIRLWEVAGASHADTYLVIAAYQDSEGAESAALAAALAPTTSFFGMTLSVPMNSGPQQHYVVSAGLEHLRRWARGGKAPPAAPRLAVTSPGSRAFALDDAGIVRGGIRSPWVDVPTGVLSGLGQTGPGFAPLFGTTKPFDSGMLAQRYPQGRSEYLEKFAAAAASAVKAGFILEADVREINALAAAAYPAAP
jgi:Alpha/beta hydrolase domain